MRPAITAGTRKRQKREFEGQGKVRGPRDGDGLWQFWVKQVQVVYRYWNWPKSKQENVHKQLDSSKAKKVFVQFAKNGSIQQSARNVSKNGSRRVQKRIELVNQKRGLWKILSAKRPERRKCNL